MRTGERQQQQKSANRTDRAASRGSTEKAQDSPSFDGLCTHFRVSCMEKFTKEVAGRRRQRDATRITPERGKNSEQLRERGVPAHEWQIYRKGMSWGVRRSENYSLSCPFSAFYPGVKDEIGAARRPPHAIRRDSGFDTPRSHRKVGFLRTKPTPTERALQELQDGESLTALSALCSENDVNPASLLSV